MAWFSGPGSPSRYSSRPRPSSTSRYRRLPRDGYINRLIDQIRKLMHNLYGYAHRHPVKVFMLVVMPLITGGVLHNILKTFGIRVPASVSRAMGGMANERSTYGRYGGDFSGGRREISGDLGGGGALQGIVKIAQMLIWTPLQIAQFNGAPILRIQTSNSSRTDTNIAGRAD